MKQDRQIPNNHSLHCIVVLLLLIVGPTLVVGQIRGIKKPPQQSLDWADVDEEEDDATTEQLLVDWDSHYEHHEHHYHDVSTTTESDLAHHHHHHPTPNKKAAVTTVLLTDAEIITAADDLGSNPEALQNLTTAGWINAPEDFPYLTHQKKQELAAKYHYYHHRNLPCPPVTDTPSVSPTLSQSPSTSKAPSASPSVSMKPSISRAPSVSPTRSPSPSRHPTMYPTYLCKKDGKSGSKSGGGSGSKSRDDDGNDDDYPQSDQGDNSSQQPLPYRRRFGPEQPPAIVEATLGRLPWIGKWFRGYPTTKKKESEAEEDNDTSDDEN